MRYSRPKHLLKVGGLVVDRKEVRYGKIDQMSREEIENRLKQIMGDVVEGDISEISDEKDLSGVDKVKNSTDNNN